MHQYQQSYNINCNLDIKIHHSNTVNTYCNYRVKLMFNIALNYICFSFTSYTAYDTLYSQLQKGKSPQKHKKGERKERYVNKSIRGRILLQDSNTYNRSKQPNAAQQGGTERHQSPAGPTRGQTTFTHKTLSRFW